MTIPVSCRSVNRDDALITRFMTGSSPYSPYRTPRRLQGQDSWGSREHRSRSSALFARGDISSSAEIRLSKTACPEAFPLWDTAEPSSPPSCGVCPTSGVERGVALRLAPGRTGRAVGVAWPPAGGAGGFRGHAPGALAQKCRLFFLSASALRTIIFPLALSQ